MKVFLYLEKVTNLMVHINSFASIVTKVSAHLIHLGEKSFTCGVYSKEGHLTLS